MEVPQVAWPVVCGTKILARRLRESSCELSYVFILFAVFYQYITVVFKNSLPSVKTNQRRHCRLGNYLAGCLSILSLKIWIHGCVYKQKQKGNWAVGICQLAMFANETPWLKTATKRTTTNNMLFCPWQAACCQCHWREGGGVIVITL